MGGGVQNRSGHILVRTWPYSLSIVLHGGLALFFWVRQPHRADSEEPPVEVVTLPPGSYEGSGERKNSRGKRLRMSDLMPSFPDAGSSPPNAARPGGAGKEGTGPSGFGSPLGLEEFAPLIPFLEAFWRRIHEAVEYPDDFARHHIQGRVWVRVSVDNRGVWNDEYLKVESDHAWLRAYVLGILLRVLKDPLPERRWAKKNPIRMVLLFDFQTTTDRKMPEQDAPKYAGTALTFQRRAYATPIVIEKLEQLMEWIPPVLPLNGGFIIDFVRLYRMIESYAGPTELELREERLKLFKAKAHGLF